MKTEGKPGIVQLQNGQTILYNVAGFSLGDMLGNVVFNKMHEFELSFDERVRLRDNDYILTITDERVIIEKKK